MVIPTATYVALHPRFTGNSYKCLIHILLNRCISDMIEIDLVLRLILAVVLGGIVGIERELVHKPAGLRTHMLVSLGSCLFTVISVCDFQMDPARIAAGIVAGIGFIGAGAVIAERTRVVGIKPQQVCGLPLPSD